MGRATSQCALCLIEQQEVIVCCLLIPGREKVKDTKNSQPIESCFKHCLCLLSVKILAVLDKVTAKGWALGCRLFVQVQYCFDFRLSWGNHCKQLSSQKDPCSNKHKQTRTTVNPAVTQTEQLHGKEADGRMGPLSLPTGSKESRKLRSVLFSPRVTLSFLVTEPGS